MGTEKPPLYAFAGIGWQFCHLLYSNVTSILQKLLIMKTLLYYFSNCQRQDYMELFGFATMSFARMWCLRM